MTLLILNRDSTRPLDFPIAGRMDMAWRLVFSPCTNGVRLCRRVMQALDVPERENRVHVDTWIVLQREQAKPTETDEIDLLASGLALCQAGSR